MKKIISVVSALVLMLGTLSVSADDYDDKNFLMAPTEQVINAFEFRSSDMRAISGTGGHRNFGYRYVVEFDFNIPAPTEANTKVNYGFRINHANKDDTFTGQTHYTKLVAENNTLWWVIGGDKNKNTEIVTRDLSCGEDYHIEIAVDLRAGKQYCRLFDASGVLKASLYGRNLEESITVDLDQVWGQNLRWGDAWVDNGDWNQAAKPTNVKVKSNGFYVLDTPEIVYENETVTASVNTYCNSGKDVSSPVLIMCIHNADNALVGVSAISQTNKSADTFPVEVPLTVSKTIKPFDGMKVTAMVLNSLRSGLPWTESVQWSYNQ